MYVLSTLSRLRSIKHMSIKVVAYCRVSTDSTDQLAADINEKQSQLEGYEEKLKIY